jgi:hypothetical protein
VLTLHILLSWEIKWNKIVEILKIFLELDNLKCSAKLKIFIITSSDNQEFKTREGEQGRGISEYGNGGGYGRSEH